MDISLCNEMYQIIKLQSKDIIIAYVIFVADFVYGYFGLSGVTAGVHRYWTHKSYKAKLPLRIILVVLYCAAGLVNSSKGINFNRY